MTVNPVYELAWPTPANPKVDPLAGTTLQYVALLANSITPVHFRTPAAIGAAKGSLQLIYDGLACNGAAGCVGELWPWQFNLALAAGDMTTNLFPQAQGGVAGVPTSGTSEGPVLSWRGIPNVPKTMQIYQMLPNTDYFANFAPGASGPDRTSFGVRLQLSAGRTNK